MLEAKIYDVLLLLSGPEPQRSKLEDALFKQLKSTKLKVALIRGTSVPRLRTNPKFNIIDLANVDSCAFIATQDLGKTNDDGSFEVLGRFDAAEIAYKRTLAINPFYLYGNIALAQLYLASKAPDKALDVLRSVRKWHTGDSEVSLYMGLAFAFQKNADLAIKEFENAISFFGKAA